MEEETHEEEHMEETHEEPAGPMTHVVDMPAGTSVPGCEETNECYIPANITINAGDTVEFVNSDTAAHTVTGGSPADGPSGVFDSSLVMGSASYSIHLLKKQKTTITSVWYIHGWSVVSSELTTNFPFFLFYHVFSNGSVVWIHQIDEFHLLHVVKFSREDLCFGITIEVFLLGTKTSSFSFAREIQGNFNPRESREFVAALS